MNKNVEDTYNNLSYHVKADIGFPDIYIYLTTEQERFIMDLFENERQAVKETLLETIDEMKGLVNEL